MSTDIKLSKAQICKIIESSGYFGSCLDNLAHKALINIVFPLPRDNLPGLVNNLVSNAINKFEKQINKKIKKNKWKMSSESRKRIYFAYYFFK